MTARPLRSTLTDRSEANLPKLDELPEGVGAWSRGWLIVVGVTLALFAVGLYAYINQLVNGLVVTDLRDVGSRGGAPWGLYVAFDVYFVGVSFAGITIAALIRLLNLRYLRPVARMAEVLTITALILASFTIVADLGQPLRGIVNLFRYARPQSPFFGTFALVIAGYLFASVVYLYLAGRRDAAICARIPHDKPSLTAFHRGWAAGYRGTPIERARHRKASFWLAIAIVPLLIVAHSTLGFVFGVQVGRPGWFSALQAPAFVLLAAVSGVGMLIVLAAIVRKLYRQEKILNERVMRWLGLFLMITILAYLYFLITEMLTGTYASHGEESAVSTALLTGRYAWLFWLSVGLLVASLALLVGQAIKRKWSVTLLVVAGVAVNLAAVGKRFLIVVPSLTEGTLLPYEAGSYAPSWVEYAVIVGLLALGALLILVFMKVFPIIDVDLEDPDRLEVARRVSNKSPRSKTPTTDSAVTAKTGGPNGA